MKHPDFNQMTIRQIARYCKCHENKIRGRMSAGGGKIKRTKEEAALLILEDKQNPEPVKQGWSDELAQRFLSLRLVKPEYWGVVY